MQGCKYGIRGIFVTDLLTNGVENVLIPLRLSSTAADDRAASVFLGLHRLRPACYNQGFTKAHMLLVVPEHHRSVSSQLYGASECGAPILVCFAQP